jgi:integrase
MAAAWDHRNMHVEDRWTRPTGTVDKRGRPGRENTERYGRGLRYLAQWTEGGQRKSKSFRTKDAANAHLAGVAKAKQDGTHVRTHKATFGEYGEEWIDAQLHHRPATSEQVHVRWRRNIKPTLGHRPLQAIEPRHVQAAVRQWSIGTTHTGPLAPATVALTYAYTSTIFKAAVRDRLIPSSPCVGINLPELDDEPVVPLTVDQVHHIADAISPGYRGMVWFAAATGMRSGELRGLTLDRLTLDGHLIVRVDRQLANHNPITLAKPKTPNSVRTISVDDISAGKLARHMCHYPPAPSGLVFTNRYGTAIPRTTASDAWREAVDGMGLPPRSGWHMLRHFHASMLIAAGLSVTAVAARLGHKDSTETLRTYAHLWPNDEERAVQAVQTHLWA